MSQVSYFDRHSDRRRYFSPLDQALRFVSTDPGHYPSAEVHETIETDLAEAGLALSDEPTWLGPYARLAFTESPGPGQLNLRGRRAGVRLFHDEQERERAFLDGEILVELYPGVERPTEVFAELNSQIVERHSDPRTFTVSTASEDEEPFTAIERFLDLRGDAVRYAGPSEMPLPVSSVSSDLPRVLDQADLGGLPTTVDIGGSALDPTFLALRPEHYRGQPDGEYLSLAHFCMGVHEVWQQVWFPSRFPKGPGEGVTVVIVDEPIFDDHPDLSVGSFSLLPSPPPSTLLRSQRNHGTQMAGIVAAQPNGRGTIGIAPGATIVSAGAELTPYPRIAQRIDAMSRALDQLIDQQVPRVIFNFSWSLEPRLPWFEREIKRARSRGYIVLAAADNQGSRLGRDNELYPVSFENVLGVGALELRAEGPNIVCGARFGSSNHGPHLDLSAPGEGYITTSRESLFVHVTKTSPACAAVSGVAALLWSIYPRATGRQIETALLAGSRTIETDEEMGRGWVHAMYSLRFLERLL